MTDKDDKPSSTLKLAASSSSRLSTKFSGARSNNGPQVEVKKIRTGLNPGSVKTPGIKAPGIKTPGIKTSAEKTSITGRGPAKITAENRFRLPGINKNFKTDESPDIEKNLKKVASASPETNTSMGAYNLPKPGAGSKIEIKKPVIQSEEKNERKPAHSRQGKLTLSEREGRFRALELAQKADAERREREAVEARHQIELETLERQKAEEEKRKLEALAAEKKAEQKGNKKEGGGHLSETGTRPVHDNETRLNERKQAEKETKKPGHQNSSQQNQDADTAENVTNLLAGGRIRKAKAQPLANKDTSKKNMGERRRSSKMSVSEALSEDKDRMRSLASIRRRREKEKVDAKETRKQGTKVVREVIIPDTIPVQELANRMAERGSDVVKKLMKLGMMATINQIVDADTAELVVEEFGHKVIRVSAEDIETGLRGPGDQPEQMAKRPPVVTIMGHVDHGKTSLLDALRSTNVVKDEAGGITQHIGAYQITLETGEKITFIDTPGHAAFSEMRARGANVTDVVILIVAADDGVMPQTIEAISHAKAAEVPIIIAINKMDKPGADPNKVITSLLQYELVAEEMGGETIVVPVSALKGEGLDALRENILLQAEILELKANPDREAEGIVVESRLEKGRGIVATVLVQRGTLRVGDIFVMGEQWGRVRALLDDRGKRIEQALPAQPVEILGLNGAPRAGDEFIVVETENRAREVSAYRQNLAQEKRIAASGKGTLEQMFSEIKSGVAKQLSIVIKADVQGSVEAIERTISNLSNDEVTVKILLGQVGAITESDITLAAASKAMVIGFNVRANPQARSMARRDAIDIRYYSIIYELIDDVKNLVSGMLKPELREHFLGYAEIRDVFEVTKIGKVAGCLVTEGVVRRNCGVRLLRNNVVIHEGKLKTLKRFKDEVTEVRNAIECGMAFENYQDIQTGDQIECFEIEKIARKID